MRIVDLSKENEKTFFVCFEEWSPDMKESGNHKEIWCRKMKDKGLRIKLAVDDNGAAGGLIQYLPIEHSFVEGKDLYFITCIWVHGHKAGIGNVQGKGMGKALVEAAEEDARRLGAKGISAWGLSEPFWMPAAWFEKHGYKEADRQGMMVLLWKPFTDDATPPKWMSLKKKPKPQKGIVTVTALKNGWCPAQNLTFERTKRAISEFGDKVKFNVIDTIDRNIIDEWGIAEGLFIDDEILEFGPPPSYEQLKSIIAEKVKLL